MDKGQRAPASAKPWPPRSQRLLRTLVVLAVVLGLAVPAAFPTHLLTAMAFAGFVLAAGQAWRYVMAAVAPGQSQAGEAEGRMC